LLALSDFKIDLSIVAAFLTIIGYSLNDTIVVFDRIREVRGKNPAITDQMVNTSLNQTLSRTVLTSGTTLIVLSILYIMGGEGVHGFSYCMLLGIIVGTFSSIFIACPALIWLSNRQLAASTRPARPVAVGS
jgi:SecD/SecF fusion protein